MIKHTQTIRRQFADELFERVSPFRDIGAWRVKLMLVVFEAATVEKGINNR